MKPSTVKSLSERVTKRNYPKYLMEIGLEKIRSFDDQKVRFDFPVTAVIGTNGGGKSTILGSAALAYHSQRPRDFFPKSTVSDASMAGWSVEYDIVDKSLSSTAKTSVRFVDKRWRRDNTRERAIEYFPIERTVPAGELSRFRKFIGSTPATEWFYQDLDKTTVTWTTKILGRDTSEYQRVFLDQKDDDYILVGNVKGNDFSQFHFGAGEASIIEIVSRIERTEKGALILIEEIENGLHPLAVDALVEYLVDVAQRKLVQVVFTTHSSIAIKKLPSIAVWACIDGNVRQGILSIRSLRAMVGDVEKSRVVFAEDEFAKNWIEWALRQFDDDLFHEVEVHASGGYPFNCKTAASHNVNPSTKSKAIALVDGDQELEDLEKPYSTALPGGVPEAEIFEYVHENRAELVSKLRQRLNVEHIQADELVVIIGDVSKANTDPHLLFSELSDRLDFISEIVIRDAFVALYNIGNETKMRAVIDQISELTETTPK